VRLDISYSEELYQWTNPSTDGIELGRLMGIQASDDPTHLYFIHHPLDKQFVLLKPSCDGQPVFVRYSELKNAPMRADYEPADRVIPAEPAFTLANYGPGSNTGHGHVWKRPDGCYAKCMGPGHCAECARDLAIYGAATP
jgi:hypothetical protein